VSSAGRLGEGAAPDRAEHVARAGEELLQCRTEVTKASEVAEVTRTASRCHHVLLARLPR
jgi:hypothetical protein